MIFQISNNLQKKRLVCTQQFLVDFWVSDSDSETLRSKKHFVLFGFSTRTLCLNRVPPFWFDSLGPGYLKTWNVWWP